ncbi:MAG: hypothetical protein U1E37_07620 [Sphingomonadaceae bacterium]
MLREAAGFYQESWLPRNGTAVDESGFAAGTTPLRLSFLLCVPCVNQN